MFINIANPTHLRLLLTGKQAGHVPDSAIDLLDHLYCADICLANDQAADYRTPSSSMFDRSYPFIRRLFYSKCFGKVLGAELWRVSAFIARLQKEDPALKMTTLFNSKTFGAIFDLFFADGFTMRVFCLPTHPSHCLYFGIPKATRLIDGSSHALIPAVIRKHLDPSSDLQANILANSTALEALVMSSGGAGPFHSLGYERHRYFFYMLLGFDELTAAAKAHEDVQAKRSKVRCP